MTKTTNKYLLTSVGLSLVFVMALMPGNISPNVDAKFYGMANMVLYDAQRNEVLNQSVHNRLLDDGETYLLHAMFSTGGSNPDADADSIGALCISSGNLTSDEGMSADTFDGANGITSEYNNCISAHFTINDQVATIGPVAFSAGSDVSDNMAADTVVQSLGICNRENGGAEYYNCESEGTLFAYVEVNAITLADGDTVDVTYIFDMTSSNT